MKHPPIVITDSRDENPRRGESTQAHEEGLCHRTVHLEIMDSEGRYLVCSRQDDRREIPGGHVDWLDEPDGGRPETYEEAALRETAEELGLVPKEYSPQQLEDAKEELRRLANPRRVAKEVNQLPSSQGNNNEHVVVYRFTFPDELKQRINLTEGTDPVWLSEEEIEEWALQPANWMRINAALRLFLRRRGIVVPLQFEFESQDQKPTVAGFGHYEWVIRKKRSAGNG